MPVTPFPPITQSTNNSITYPYLDLQDRSATIAIPTTPTLWKPPTIVTSSGGMLYDSSTGVITLPESRAYSVFTMSNISTTGARTLYTYVDVDVGAGFAASRYSGRRMSVSSAIDGQVVTVSRNVFQAGTKLRFYLWTSGATDAVTTDLPNVAAGTVTSPAFRFLICA